jgi:GH15 family glucan-1,4-alpha-glucosidase
MPSRIEDYALNIEDYALNGDCETAALVSKDGSVDRLCWPRLDSGACFAARNEDIAYRARLAVILR